MDKKLKSKLLPLVLPVVVIVLDQITKFLVTTYLPLRDGELVRLGPSFLGDFLRIIHVNNPGVAFSFGTDWPLVIRRLAFSAFPVAILVIVMLIYFKSDTNKKGYEFTKLQRWAIAGIVGGGVGNIIDRLFRADGVVDFIDVKFFGIFGLERWPTFNVADSAVVVCGIILIVSYIVQSVKEAKKTSKDSDKKEKKNKEQEND
ncbi:MAG: signal peptidase II [Treponema sp.]|nr:signal peptidase II [Treponema sp.]